MMPAWYQRMNPRERVLAWVAAGTVLVLLNLFILDWIFGALASAQKQMASRKATLAEQALYVKERDLWTKRDEWIRQNQPTLKDPAEASALLDQLKEIAGKYNVLVENPAIGSGEATPYHQTVDAFIVFENVNLAIDGSDPTMMRGKFKIARWFAPAQRTK
jgi:hypothetical protein